MHLTRLLTLLVMELRADFSQEREPSVNYSKKILDFSGGEKKLIAGLQEIPKLSIFN